MILVTGVSGFVGGKLIKECKDTIACPSLKGLAKGDSVELDFERKTSFSTLHLGTLLRNGC